MNKLVLEIGFGELLVAVMGALLVGVLLMLLYHRLAMRRERERFGIRLRSGASHQSTIPPSPPVARTTPTETPASEIDIPEQPESLDFRKKRWGKKTQTPSW